MMTVTEPDPATVDWAEVYHLVHTMVLVNGYPRQMEVAKLAQEELDALIPPIIPPSPSLFAPNQSTNPVITVTTAGPLTAIPGNIATTGPNAGTPQGLQSAVAAHTAARGEAGATGPFPKKEESSTHGSSVPPIPPDDKKEDNHSKRRW
jgi:hypothetical protein